MAPTFVLDVIIDFVFVFAVIFVLDSSSLSESESSEDFCSLDILGVDTALGCVFGVSSSSSEELSSVLSFFFTGDALDVLTAVLAFVITLSAFSFSLEVSSEEDSFFLLFITALTVVLPFI